jgi:hypothetical protein
MSICAMHWISEGIWTLKSFCPLIEKNWRKLSILAMAITLLSFTIPIGFDSI